MPPLNSRRPGRSFSRNRRWPQGELALGRIPPIWRIIPTVLVWALLWTAGAATSHPAEPAPAATAPPERAEVVALVGQLDSDRYEIRQKAAERLRQLAADPQAGRALAGEVSRILVAPDTSFEVRRALETLLPVLPAPLDLPPPEVAHAEIDGLVAQLESADFGQRTSARQRLEWLAGNPRLAGLVLLRAKERLNRPELSLDGRKWVEAVYKEARRAWLATDPKLWTLPTPTQVQVAEWIEQLAQPPPPGTGVASRAQWERAFRELQDALAWDDQVPRIRQALELKLGRPGLSPQAAERLRRLLDLCRPAMVAECWGRISPQTPTRLVGTQWLVVGVPSLGLGAERPSHFDRIDDQVAHCVSGQNLSPGDYPVGVAFPHPKQPGYLFHLVNLTSPRRLMAYGYLCERPMGARLAELSQRTFRWMLARRQPLSAGELNMMRLLDRTELSRFAGAFLEMVEDQPIPEAERARLPDAAWPAALGEETSPGRGRTGFPSRHGTLCEILAQEGTPEAVPGLLRAIQTERLLPPRPSAPYRLDALAVLAIAARNPSSDSDAWLAALLTRTDALVLGLQEPPEVGATAGAMLLRRHGQVPSEFGLQPAEDPYLSAVGVAGYHAVSAEGLARLQQWWTARKERPDGP